MVNNFRKILSGSFLLFILLTVIVSCSNLPGKEVQRAGSTPAVPPVQEIPDNNLQTYDDPSQSYVPDVWTAPGEGPTVTPVILNIEKTGEAGSVIVRSDFVYEEPAVVEEVYQQVPQQLPAAPGGLTDAMEVYSYNPMNGSTVLPGQAIHLDITLKNTGTTTWQTSYKVVDYSNMSMAVTKEYNLPYPVAPGGTVLLSVYLAAPSGQGSYPENFQIQDSYGVVFGKFDYILTVGDFSVASPIPTLTATITPTYYSPDGITATPDSLAWMCIDRERSKLQDCYSFCVEYSHREEFKNCYYDGNLYEAPAQ